MRIGQCTPAEENVKKTVDKGMFGGMDITAFNKNTIMVDGKPKDMIASSLTMLVEHPTLGNVLNYVRLRFFEDNSVELYSSMIDPKGYKTLQKMKFMCSMSTGKDQNGISVFRD